MSSIQPLLNAWDEGHRELGIALEGISTEDLWKRAHPRLLSVGELAGHVAYWQAEWTQTHDASGPSPLLNPGFRYYTSSVGEPTVLDMDASTLFAEVMRVHEIARATAAANEIESQCPGQWGTWGVLVTYQGFHVAYHTGQIYSVRHLFGHETEDN